MQPVQRPNKRTAAALLVLATGLAGLTVPISSAFAQTRRAAARPPQIPASAVAPQQVSCTQQNCALNRRTGMSTVSITPTEVAAGTAPSFAAPTSNPADGMLTGNGMQDVLSCGGYRPTDSVSFQFYIGGTNRANVFYKVTDTVNSTDMDKLQFCLGATFRFTTRSGKSAGAVKLPNDLPGFAGLVPTCGTPVKPPCMVSKTPVGRTTVLKVLIPAVGGDPWGRA
jgi:hypothetical protein